MSITSEHIVEAVSDAAGTPAEWDADEAVVELGFDVIAGIYLDDEGFAAFIGDRPDFGYDPNRWVEWKDCRTLDRAEIWLTNKIYDFRKENDIPDPA
jgi:hypothetical protein